MSFTPGLFDNLGPADGQEAAPVPIEAGAYLLPGFAQSRATELLAAIHAIAAEAPFRHMVTPGGHRMSVAITSSGRAGWVSDENGYRYSRVDPISGAPWPPMDPLFSQLGEEAAARAGHSAFAPDAGIVNRYAVKARMTLHQDRNEPDRSSPIVSVSLGLPAVFQFGGPERSSPVKRIAVEHGDVVVWGGPSRLFFHGVLPVAPGKHAEAGPYRYNLTLRRTAAS